MTPGLPSWTDAWCREFLGAAPVQVLFCVSHLSEVVGAVLADGREVVMKRRVDESGRADRCVRAQKLLAEQGFPCPMPLTDVILDDGVAVHAERFVRDGELESDDTPAAAAGSAMLFADLLRLLRGFDLDPPLPNPEWVRWDSPPERQTSARVPSWIADTAQRVQTKLAESALPDVLGHADWEAQNMRWRNDEPLAVHDWDSLAWLPEAALAGTAAGVFASHGQPTLAPVASSAAFLDTYETARGVPFSPHETEIAWAASIWVALHNARDELVYNRPRLSYETLRAQRTERLTLARA
ncbi:MAG TPA: phosphotransferase [Gaiellaceae bacterium]|nr:phosphotransferase [Gaiellaceae bacterium]